jgi:hypothetical protein
VGEAFDDVTNNFKCHDHKFHKYMTQAPCTSKQSLRGHPGGVAALLIRAPALVWAPLVPSFDHGQVCAPHITISYT